ncbi:glycosyltransferase [Allorhizobium sp. BGMRC 0089]|uniref:CgeB family protein n=1 Tax=Allorhizobium sonneratiae TaxID=2934936 RepID=UPI002033A3FE|nr:glycosyltransferase [Allorhizobium sonneratiae]MCM2293982.1 glycosyltransferase [Allorhizobium sonneratiae]
MSRSLDLVFIGLSLSSSWGNGHATTYRALLRGLKQEGHSVLFLERDTPWYADNRDLPEPDFCTFATYRSIDAMLETHGERLRTADAVIIGSYVPEGIAVIDRVMALRPRRICCYDIDTPVTMALLDGQEADYLAMRQVPLFDVYFSFSGGPVLTLLKSHYGARHPAALYCSVDPALYRNSGEPPRWDLGYLGTYSVDRQKTLETLLIEPARLLPERRFVVAGSQYPDTIVWPDNVERIEHLPPSQHAAFYSRQRFTLNVTRANMIAAGWSPSVRLFEAAACGVPIISDWWPGLDELLPKDEAILVARGVEDVVAALTEMPDARRTALADAARDRVMSGHTGRMRARELVQTLSAILPRPFSEKLSATR